MNWDRFDICEAYWMYYCHYHASGMTPRCVAKDRNISVQLHNMQFRPRPLLNDEFDLTENGRAIYEALIERWELGDAA